MSAALLLFATIAVGCNPTQDPAAFLYLAWDDSGLAQLYRADGRGRSEQLTDFESSVLDYAVAPDGRHLAAAVGGGSDTTELWLMDSNGRSQEALLVCEQVECMNLLWAPDGRRIMFEKRPYGRGGAAGAPTLWWIDAQTAETRPVLQGQDQLGAMGRLSSDGQWLSYASPNNEGMSIYNFEDGRRQFITNEIGTPAAWSPDGTQLVLPRFDLVITHGEGGDDHLTHEHGYVTAIHLFLLDVESGDWQNISGDLGVEDSVPVWSPDGQWIAFGRRLPGTAAARQLWVTRPDGSDMRALTDDAQVNHGPPSWSPDGRFLLFQQIPQSDLSADPSIWRLDVQTGAKERLVESGAQPAWLPPFT